MDFLVSRVKVPPAYVLHAKGEIALEGQAILERALTHELYGHNPIIVDLSAAGIVAESQVSGPILRALESIPAGRDRADKVAVVGVAPGIRRLLEAVLGEGVWFFANQEQALENLGVSPMPLGEECGPTNHPGRGTRRDEIDRAEYLAAFASWIQLLEEHEIYRTSAPALWAWWSQVDRDRLPARGKIEDFCRLMPNVDHRLHLTIAKSNLLYRMLYLGEPVRKRPCPGVQLTFGKKAFRHHPFSECRCGGCHWLP